MLVESDPVEISCFLYGCFLDEHPSQDFFLETMIVSRYCLKFLFSKNCSHCIKDALVKNNMTIWGCNCCYIFLDSKSFFMSVSRWHFILKSMKVYLARSVIYLRYICFLVGLSNFLSLHLCLGWFCCLLCCCCVSFCLLLFCYSTGVFT